MNVFLWNQTAYNKHDCCAIIFSLPLISTGHYLVFIEINYLGYLSKKLHLCKINNLCIYAYDKIYNYDFWYQIYLYAQQLSASCIF
jgi:hypothetical protein